MSTSFLDLIHDRFLVAMGGFIFLLLQLKDKHWKGASPYYAKLDKMYKDPMTPFMNS